MTRRDHGPKDGRSYGGLSKEQRVAQRQTRLIDAALELFGTQGYAATSIERLCSVANVSTRSFYEDMGSREALLIALANRITSRALECALTALAATRNEPLPTRVVASFRAYLGVTCADARTARVLYVEVVGVSAAVEEWRRQQRRLLSALLISEAERAVGRGETGPRRFDLFALAVIGAVTSLAQELVQGTAPDSVVSLDEICEEIAYFVNSGLSRTRGDDPAALPDRPVVEADVF
ncbi:TetR/AcrR family transcriptional regulator [Nocardia sp. CDC186]|uniref:TetR/AcrR family transcriptional regulator n=1 Tax=Nocardia implantans TaxID=3108168 RepID=A0ABU6B4K1_9NOCA|nr:MULTISPECIES: TetR/AcrR family transcriptional regulator [unclassified Nocardia]MBF6193237.1 TetR/AcrR family transcriptional regulator [Nocardia beijingensis]MEA3531626.1 TetR/AcrR family transcriptional regulator [Nocardia sp. CDC192]MEB3514619.1 TetR/AcrR family transcriptional regulator [Nocardia sp. CDC186]